MHQIQKYPLWDNFDISLLCKAIKLACEGVAREDDTKWKDENEMEGLIIKIKDTRNKLIHEVTTMTEAEYLAKVDELENLFLKSLNKAKAKYNVPATEFIPVRDRAIQDISKIKQMEKDVSIDYWTAMLPEFIKKTQEHLQKRYKQLQYFDPLSFLCGSVQGEVDIQSIFCKIPLAKQEQNEETREICDILTFTQPMAQNPQPSTSSQSTQGKKPQLVIIRGVAGSGKTTLLSFILSEWLKNSPHCHIKHLHEYDIVLRIMCREEDGPSLKDFLKQTLQNNLTVMEEYLVMLLKKCKVLFLIDGLDELSPGSAAHKLVEDIVNIGKNVPEFIIMCTSRPETFYDFWNIIPNSYQRWKMNMKGVTPELRTNFVLKHYDTFPSNSNEDRERLRLLMDGIGWRDHFELPLNLLFVATLFKTDPDCVKSNVTQTSLYLTIHMWCIQKLQGRLAGDPQVVKDRQAREDGIHKVLEIIYDVALQGLLQDRLSLSEGDTRQLRDMCKVMNLPFMEVMGAFLCLRESVIRMIPQQKYTAPHKSFQEFYAAKKIVHELKENSSADSIRRLLHDPSPGHLKKLQNLLLHVVALLCHPDTPSHPAAIKVRFPLIFFSSCSILKKQYFSCEKLNSV